MRVPSEDAVWFVGERDSEATHSHRYVLLHMLPEPPAGSAYCTSSFAYHSDSTSWCSALARRFSPGPAPTEQTHTDRVSLPDQKLAPATFSRTDGRWSWHAASDTHGEPAVSLFPGLWWARAGSGGERRDHQTYTKNLPDLAC